GRRTASVVSLYLILAVAMFIAWLIAPTFALGLFLAMAMAHFAEDWADAEHPLFAIGLAASLMSAPALFHHQMMAELFVQLTGEPNAAGLADALLLVAPLASSCALLAIVLLWSGGYRATACSAACALTAMILLPPITGFAIYFCLIHSPAQFQSGMRSLDPSKSIAQPTIIATLGGLAIALAALPFLPAGEPSSRLFMASFMTLSILTLPHMVVPLIMRRF
ncbi:MAG: Brp/Blh family beta-carotene 15,15'-dioxygenase, partial [Sphingomicrobium sp.]